MSRATALMPSGSATRSELKTAAPPAARGHGARRPGSASSANRSIAADEAHQLALDLHPVGAIEPRLIGRVGCFQRDGIAAPAQPLQGRFRLVDQCDYD